MLGQIANYCLIISRNTLVKNSTSIQFIWHTIKHHFEFQVTGALFIDFADIHLEEDEHPEDLYQRLMAFVDDILLQIRKKEKVIKKKEHKKNEIIKETTKE